MTDWKAGKKESLKDGRMDRGKDGRNGGKKADGKR